MSQEAREVGGNQEREQLSWQSGRELVVVDDGAPPALDPKSWRKRVADHYYDDVASSLLHGDFNGHEEVMLDFVSNVWLRDSHDLFDYESESNKLRSMRITIDVGKLLETNRTNVYLYRRDIEVQVSVDEDCISADMARLYSEVGSHLRVSDWHSIAIVTLHSRERITIEPWNYFSDRPQIPAINVTVRDAPRSRVSLDSCIGLRMGRYKLQVHEQCHEAAEAVIPDISLLESKNPEQQVTVHGDTDEHCRVCLCPDDPEDPLISACKCRGSIKYVHLNCMRQWIRSLESNWHSREDNGNQDGTHMDLTSLKCVDCEICRSPLPPWMPAAELPAALVHSKENEESYDPRSGRFYFITVSKQQAPFITLRTPDEQKVKLYVIAMRDLEGVMKEKVTIGRGHEANIRISDVSISRKHANVIYEENQFWLEDLSSKFGTLIANDGEVSLTPNKINTMENGKGSMVFHFQSGRVQFDMICRNKHVRDERGEAAIRMIPGYLAAGVFRKFQVIPAAAPGMNSQPIIVPRSRDGYSDSSDAVANNPSGRGIVREWVWSLPAQTSSNSGRGGFNTATRPAAAPFATNLNGRRPQPPADSHGRRIFTPQPMLSGEPQEGSMDEFSVSPQRSPLRRRTPTARLLQPFRWIASWGGSRPQPPGSPGSSGGGAEESIL